MVCAGRAASKQAAFSGDNAGAGLRKNRALGMGIPAIMGAQRLFTKVLKSMVSLYIHTADLNLWAHATFDVRLAQAPDAVVPKAVVEGALPPYCATYLITNAMARLYADGISI